MATEKQIEKLTQLTLTELRELYTDLIGEPTRAPNKKYLAKKILEARAKLKPTKTGLKPSRPRRPTSPAKRKRTVKQPEKKTPAKKTPAKKKTPAGKDASGDKPLSKLSVPKLQERYKEIVGRTTGSKNAAYLIWKIRQAQNGKIPVGPTQRRSSTNPGDYKVIPLRMETEVVDQIDAARERLELPSRTTLIRRALMLYLAKAGENDVAALLEQGE